MKLENIKVLVLAPHIDDAEFGCGGTLSKLIANNCEILYVAFSDCKGSIPTNLPKDILRRELEASAKVLKIQDFRVLDFPVRNFTNHRQEILQYLIDLKEEFKPELVFTPSRLDIHQDHEVVTNECMRAFKHCSIFGYELPWNCFSFPMDIMIGLSAENLNTKVNAISCYQSQAHRNYHDEDYIWALAKTRGLRINYEFAETFELIRLLYK